jgi:hypothetical protein
VFVADETRPIFQGLHTVGEAAFYVASFLTVAVFAWGFWRRVRKYRRGRPAARMKVLREAVFGSPLRGVRKRADTWSVGAVVANSPVARRDRWAGVAHFFIFWGFVTLFLGTVILTIDYDIVRNAGKLFVGHEVSFFHGTFYYVYSVVLDTMGLTAVLGLAYMAARRGIMRPRQLDYTRAQTPEGGYSRHRIAVGDWVFLGGFAAILLSGYLLEGFRIRADDFPSFEVWSPVGWLAARMFEAVGMSAGAAQTAHLVQWWAHAALALGFVAYIPFSKAMHTCLLANLLVRQVDGQAPAVSARRRRPRRIPGDRRLHLEGVARLRRLYQVRPMSRRLPRARRRRPALAA